MQQLSLSKYLPLFVKEDIDIESLYQLTDSEMQQIGIPLGGRKKIFQALERKKEEKNPLYIRNVVIKDKIGAGCFGEVFEALWHDTSKVAAKKMKKEDMQEFLVEAEILKHVIFRNLWLIDFSSSENCSILLL